MDLVNNSTLITELFALGEFTDGNWEAAHEHASDPEVVGYVDRGQTLRKKRGISLDEQWRLIERNHAAITNSQ